MVACSCDVEIIEQGWRTFYAKINDIATCNGTKVEKPVLPVSGLGGVTQSGCDRGVDACDKFTCPLSYPRALSTWKPEKNARIMAAEAEAKLTEALKSELEKAEKDCIRPLQVCKLHN